MCTALAWTAIALLLFFLSSFGPALAQPLGGLPQDPIAGSRVFGAKTCARCHSIEGIGPKAGPDLGRVPGPRSFPHLAAAMWNHPGLSASHLNPAATRWPARGRRPPVTWLG